MTIWTDTEPATTPYDPKSWYTSPVWYTIIEDRQISGYQDVLDIAQECWNWIAASEYRDNFKTGRGARLVSAMYDPISSKVYVSSIPRGSRYKQLKAAVGNEQQSIAPKWYAAAQKSPLGRLKQFHAEDAIFIEWERNGGAIQSGPYPYPRGSILAVWAAKPWLKNDMPQESHPCSECKDVCKSLGVIYKGKDGVFINSQSGPIPQLAPDTQSDDDIYTFDEDLYDWERVCEVTDAAQAAKGLGGSAKRGNGGSLIPQHIRRDNSSNPCGSPPTPSSTYTPSFTLSDLPSTYQLPSITLTPITFTESGTSSQTATTQTTTTPAPSCSMQNADPDSGRNKADCVCDGSITLPLISAPATAIATMSCAYTALPTGSATLEIITTKPSLGPATTISQSCQVCTPVENNADDCTTISGCVIQTAQATVTAGSTAIPVGTLTGDALYTTISNALESLCPSATSGSMTSCTPTAEVTLKNIAYVVDDGLETDGEVIVAIESSGYNVTSLRDALIRSIATATQWGASGNNCYVADYKIEVPQEKRSLDLRNFWPVSSLFPRQETSYPTTYENANITLCNTNWFQAASYYNPYWHIDDGTSPSAWINADYVFDIVPPGGDFWCDEINALVAALSIIEPEFAVEDVELESAIQFTCGKDDE